MDSVVCHDCSVEGMFHCPYLLHKFIINYLFDYFSVCGPCLFELLTALLEYLNLLQGDCKIISPI